jgi:RecA-family ATPase
LINFGTCDSGELTPFFDDLDATLRDFKPALLVIDTAADTFGGNENIRPQVRRFIGTCLGRLAIEHDCGVVLLAHPSQAGLRDGSGTSGSTAWGNTVRSRIYMTRPSEEEGGALSDRRILTRMKANYAACGARVDIVWRNGAFVLAEAAEAFDAATWPVIHAMFDELEKAWSEGRAWSYRAETRTGGRYFPSWARKQLGVPEDRTKHLLSEWLESGCLTFEMFDARAKTKGLRVIRRPDQ